LKLEIREHVRAFDLTSGFMLMPVGYHLALLDAAESEILAYHWHPHGLSRITTPHLHLGLAAQVRQRDLARAHLPTGLIALTDFIELLIEGFGVEPRLKNWREVLAGVRASR
jgi:hypothetical protein